MTEDIKERYAESFKRNSEYLKEQCKDFNIPTEKETYKNAKAFLSMLPMRDLLEVLYIEAGREVADIKFKWYSKDGFYFEVIILENNEMLFGFTYNERWKHPIISFDRNEIPKTLLYKLNLLRK